MNIKDTLFACIRDVIFNEKEALNGVLLTDDELSSLYSLSKKHDVAQIVGVALTKNGILKHHDSAFAAFRKEIDIAVFRQIHLDRDIDIICGIFEAAGIDHIPLKGAVIRSLYPEPWLRTSGDIDVLVREEDLNRAVEVLNSNGFGFCKRNYHDVLFTTQNNNNYLELHFNIKENYKQLDDTLLTVWDYATPISEGSHRFCLSKEFLVFYHLAHMANHFYCGGCGIRSFIDFEIMLSGFEINEEILSKLLIETRLSVFYNAVFHSAKEWFFKGEKHILSDEIQRYIFDGGVYGSTKNSTLVHQREYKTKIGYVLSRIFPPYKEMAVRYSILIKKPILTPFYYIYRIFTLLSNKKKMKKNAKELKVIKQTTDENLKRIDSLISKLDISDK